jgi:cell division transport system permease protein
MKWLIAHWRAVFDASFKIKLAPLSFIFNAIVVALALALPMSGWIVLQDLQPLSNQVSVDPEISIYLSMDLPRDKAESLAADFKRLTNQHHVTASLTFIPRESALENLNKQADLTDVVSSLGSNPLPDAYVVKLTGSTSDARVKQVQDLATALEKVEGVHTVQLDTLWLKRLAAVFTLASSLFWFVAATLCCVVVAVVFNTIRLQLLTHADEINVSRLLGATDAFIARPFYYTGAFLGLLAGLLSLAIVLTGIQLLNQPVAALALSYGTVFQLSWPNLGTVLFPLLVGVVLGFLGASLSVWRSLRRSL